MKTKDITLVALMASLICVAGPMVVPIGPVPLSLASFAVYLSGAVLGPKKGTLAVVVYLLIGMIGIPVFSGFSGGLQKLVGVTGGYIIGYIPCAFCSGFGSFADQGNRKKMSWQMPLGMVTGTVILYFLGTIWFVFQTGNSVTAALGICVFPFIPGDIIKIITASVVSYPVRQVYMLKGSNAA